MMDRQTEFEIKAEPMQIIQKICMSVAETEDEFIFKTIIGFLQNATQMSISKKELLDAVNKQRPMKPRLFDDFHMYCGNCNKRLSMKHKPQYCMRCGQKVK